jgi:hypothetical protein
VGFAMEENEEEERGLNYEINNQDLIRTVTIKNPNNKYILKMIIYPEDPYKRAFDIVVTL